LAFNKNRVMEVARRYVDKGQIDKAIKEYLRVVKEDPQDVRVWLKIGDLYAKKGAKGEAIDTYLKVAKFYGEQGFYLKAVAVYKQILKLDPRLIEVNLKLAELYRQLGLMSDAMRHFEMVAGHFHREGKTKEAMATVRQLVELDPENVATRIKLAELYSKEGMVEESVTEFTQACEYLRANNRQDDFVKVAERLLWHKPDNTELNRELAGLYLRRNDPRRALQKLQVCFKANSRDVDTLALLAQAFQALEQKSKTVQVLKELARVLDEDGKRDRAQEVHRKILAFVPGDPDSLAYVGQGAAGAAGAAGTAARVEPPQPPQPPPPPPARPQLVTSQDVAPRRRHNPTGSMPLVDPHAIPGLNFGNAAAAAGEQADFTSDFTEDSSFVEASAEAEQHSEEIAKLLTETEVYIKYGLHQKAIDHLRRVFELDEQNIEARERLKDILLDQGRENDAVLELMRLAEMTAPHDHERAAGYVGEILGINGTYQPALELAERFHLDMTGEVADIEIIDDDLERTRLHGGMAGIEDDIDFADIGFEEDNELLVDPGATRQISAGIGQAAQYTDEIEAEPFEFDFESSVVELDPGESPDASGVTMEISVDEVASLYELTADDHEAEAIGFDSRSPAVEPAYGFGSAARYADQPLIEPVFDPADAAAFDAEPGFDPGAEAALDLSRYQGPGAQVPGGGPGQTAEYGAYRAQSSTALTSSYDAAPPGYGAAAGATAEYATAASNEFGAGDFDAEPLADLAEFAVDFEGSGEYRPTQDLLGARTKETPAGSNESLTTIDTNLDELEAQMMGRQPDRFEQAMDSLEDDLDEADFFISQGLYDEARDIIKGLLIRYPEHPLLLTKLQDLTALEGTTGEATKATPLPHIGFDELDRLEDIDASGGSRSHQRTRPAVFLEKPVDDEDADTHYDLGLAYKEMGLYDDAINAFAKVAENPAREVQCRLMIGLCYREQDNLSDAIQQFKAGLHAPGINEPEQLSLYYEIATSYEMLGDPKEAMYFYRLIGKREPNYRDVPQRVVVIASGVERGGGQGRAWPPSGDDADAAIDSLLAESDSRRRGG
jgi:pilus assembly protein FimV